MPEKTASGYLIGSLARDAESLFLDTGLGAMVCVERVTLGLRWVGRDRRSSVPA